MTITYYIAAAVVFGAMLILIATKASSAGGTKGSGTGTAIAVCVDLWIIVLLVHAGHVL